MVFRFLSTSISSESAAQAALRETRQAPSQAPSQEGWPIPSSIPPLGDGFEELWVQT